MDTRLARCARLSVLARDRSWSIDRALVQGDPRSPGSLLWIALDPTEFSALGGTLHADPVNTQLLLFTNAGGGLILSNGLRASAP